jgi:hypothetical protein
VWLSPAAALVAFGRHGVGIGRGRRNKRCAVKERGCGMAIYRLLQNSAFGPEEIARMTTAYEDALRVLGLTDRADPMTEILAKKIIEIAQTGERDPARICANAVASI